jgi:hypothetical protein
LIRIIPLPAALAQKPPIRNPTQDRCIRLDHRRVPPENLRITPVARNIRDGAPSMSL